MNSKALEYEIQFQQDAATAAAKEVHYIDKAIEALEKERGIATGVAKAIVVVKIEQYHLMKQKESHPHHADHAEAYLELIEFERSLFLKRQELERVYAEIGERKNRKRFRRILQNRRNIELEKHKPNLRPTSVIENGMWEKCFEKRNEF